MKGKEEKKKYFVASVSWGKDSLYMLEHILINLHKYPLHLVIFVNTGMEFQAVYDMRDKMLVKLSALSIPYKEIDVSAEWKYLMFYHRPKTRDGTEKIGLGWCGGVCRWGTGLKLESLNRYYRRELSAYDVTEYVGIACDETERLESEFAKANEHKKKYPLLQCIYG